MLVGKPRRGREVLDGCGRQLPLVVSGDTEGGPREGQLMKRPLGLQYTTWKGGLTVESEAPTHLHMWPRLPVLVSMVTETGTDWGRPVPSQQEVHPTRKPPL